MSTVASPFKDFLKANKFRVNRGMAYLRGLFNQCVVLNFYLLLQLPIPDVSRFQRFVSLRFTTEFSQNGEDGILQAIFRKLSTTNKYFVEFGAEDGVQCNTRFLMKKYKWHGVLFDGNPPEESGVQKEYITAENIQDIFRKHGVPHEFDLLSIDIDGNDYWVWKAITEYRPRVVIVEYNAHIPLPEKKTVPYDPVFVWDGTDYYGASLAALESLARSKGYHLIATDKHGVNAFFVQEELLKGNFKQRSLEEIFHAASFKGVPGKHHPGDMKGRKWEVVV